MKFKKIGRKGFIGTIGDDLPSLIPIMVALVLFFTIFTLTLNSYNSKNIELNKNMSLLSISREIKGDSLIINVDQFTSRCKSLRLNNHKFNFKIAIYPSGYFSNPSAIQVIKDFQQNNFDKFLKAENKTGTIQPYFCDYIRNGSRDLSDKKINYLVRFYPIAVQQEIILSGEPYKVILPSLMVMVIWD